MSFVRKVVAGAILASFVTAAMASPLHIQIPVRLAHAKVVWNIDHKAFIPGTHMPFALTQAPRMVKKFNRDHTNWKMTMIFHGIGGYMLLDNASYDRFTHTKGGNPYAKPIRWLYQHHVDIEECGVTARIHHWGNANFFPFVRVNAGGLPRLIQLEQRGYIAIQP